MYEKLYKIPYSDNYYLSKKCFIYKAMDDNILSEIKENDRHYNILYKGKSYVDNLSSIICRIFYGYSEKSNPVLSDEDPIHLSHYEVISVLKCDGYILVNGEKFEQSPRWNWLYGNKYGAIFDSRIQRFRRQKQDKDGYARFAPNHNLSNIAVHRFIYECWNHILINSNMVVHHKDSDKLNNSISNLEYITSSRNTRYTILLKEKKLDEYYTEMDIHKMCQMMQDGKDYRSIAAEFNVDVNDQIRYKRFRSRLSLLLQQKSAWTDISSQYNFDNYIGNRPIQKFSSNDIIQMHHLHKNGINTKDIAAKFDTSIQFVQSVLSGRKRKKEYKRFEESSTTIESIT